MYTVSTLYNVHRIRLNNSILFLTIETDWQNSFRVFTTIPCISNLTPALPLILLFLFHHCTTGWVGRDERHPALRRGRQPHCVFLLSRGTYVCTHTETHIYNALLFYRHIYTFLKLFLTLINVRTGVRSVRSVQRQESCSVFEVHDAVQGAYAVWCSVV